MSLTATVVPAAGLDGPGDGVVGTLDGLYSVRGCLMQGGLQGAPLPSFMQYTVYWNYKHDCLRNRIFRDAGLHLPVLMLSASIDIRDYLSSYSCVRMLRTFMPVFLNWLAWMQWREYIACCLNFFVS